jgi:hypothetical protein
MFKWMYDRMKKEYEKQSKEDLIHEILSLEEIECSDRCFANQCEAGSSIYKINELFEKLDEVLSNNSISADDKIELLERLHSAKNEWSYIKSGIREMNNNSRCYEYLDKLKDRVKNAKEDRDVI